MQKPISSPAMCTEAAFQDKHHRRINYLRLSVTDRCTLRCNYCMPEGGIAFVPHREILTYEEMYHVVRLCVLRGIRRVRLTGGEPLVRRGILPFIASLSYIHGLEEITLITNGVLLKELVHPLKDCGIVRINVSMDTLRPERFHRIARREYFNRVWEGIEEAEAAGLSPVTINVVAIRGVNDDEILDFARLTYRNPYHVRFIEMMPVGENNAWTSERFVSTQETLTLIRRLGPLRPVNSGPLEGPGRYALEGARGEIGLIGALSHHFCENCSRLRLTADGHLKGCLFSDQETDLKTPLRQRKDDAYLLNLIEKTIVNKPEKHGSSVTGPRKCARSMNSMGVDDSPSTFPTSKPRA